MELFGLAIRSIFIQNILLAYFLGMCSFLAISKNMRSSIGLGLAVVFVLTITTPVNWLFHHFLLQKGALSWLGLTGIDLSFLSFIVFIAVIASLVQLVEMFIARYSEGLYNALGIFLPLITVNCAILGAALFMVEREYDLASASVFGFSSGVGFFMAITAMAAIRRKLRCANVPRGLRGLGITMIVTGLMSMTFMCFSGIDF